MMGFFCIFRGQTEGSLLSSLFSLCESHGQCIVCASYQSGKSERGGHFQVPAIIRDVDFWRGSIIVFKIWDGDWEYERQLWRKE